MPAQTSNLAKLFVGRNFRHLVKISSLSTDKVLTDKVSIQFKRSNYSLSWTFDISNFFSGPLRVRDIESWLYIYTQYNDPVLLWSGIIMIWLFEIKFFIFIELDSFKLTASIIL